MKKWEQRMAEIMEMDDARKAYIDMTQLLFGAGESLDVLEMMMEQYMAKHGVDLDEMTLYPDGERVLKPEHFNGL